METLRNTLTRLEKEGSALGHFNVADLVLLKAVVAAATELRSSVLIGVSEGEREFFGTRQLAALVRSLREEYDLPIFINADHTHSLAKAMEAASAGFDLVGIDFSALPFEQNVSRTKEAVEALRAVNPAILVEGEIGDIGTGSEIHGTAQITSRLVELLSWFGGPSAERPSQARKVLRVRTQQHFRKRRAPARPHRGRRTVLSFPLFPPPQKN